MDEEALSRALFLAARDSIDFQVLSWQAVNGKGYFTADVKLRLPSGERMEPDLILASSTTLWLLEAKALHSEAIADEWKLVRLLEALDTAEILRQVSRRSSVDVTTLKLSVAVAFAEDDVQDVAKCVPSLTHVCWNVMAAAGLPPLSPLTWPPAPEE